MKKIENYNCPRCRRDSEIVGFCEKCYFEVYGLHGMPIEIVKIEELKVKDKYLTAAEREVEYSREICESIKKDGLKNPIIIDKDNLILIGYHRYFIIKDLGWEEIPAIRVPISDIYGKFAEGKCNNLIIIRIDGKVVASFFDPEDAVRLFREFIRITPIWKQTSLVIECFFNIGAKKRV